MGYVTSFDSTVDIPLDIFKGLLSLPQKNNCRNPEIRLIIQTIHPIHLYKQYYANPNIMAAIIPLRKEGHTFVQKVHINPRTTAKDLMNTLQETGTKTAIPIKRDQYRHNLKGCSARRKPFILFAALHGDKDLTYRLNVLWSD